MSILDYIESAKVEALTAKAAMEEHWSTEAQEVYDDLRCDYRALVCQFAHSQIALAIDQYTEECAALKDSWEVCVTLDGFMSSRGLKTAIPRSFITDLNLPKPPKAMVEPESNRPCELYGNLGDFLGVDGVSVFDDVWEVEPIPKEMVEKYERPLVADGPIGTGSTYWTDTAR
jgi:hypothetical protein